MSTEQRFLLVLGLALISVCALSGCSVFAGHQAMVIQRAQVMPPCGIKVCTPSGVSNRIDPKKDCVCSGKQSLEDIFK